MSFVHIFHILVSVLAVEFLIGLVVTAIHGRKNYQCNGILKQSVDCNIFVSVHLPRLVLFGSLIHKGKNLAKVCNV